VNTRIW